MDQEATEVVHKSIDWLAMNIHEQGFDIAVKAYLVTVYELAVKNPTEARDLYYQAFQALIKGVATNELAKSLLEEVAILSQDGSNSDTSKRH